MPAKEGSNPQKEGALEDDAASVRAQVFYKRQAIERRFLQSRRDEETVMRAADEAEETEAREAEAEEALSAPSNPPTPKASLHTQHRHKKPRTPVFLPNDPHDPLIMFEPSHAIRSPVRLELFH